MILLLTLLLACSTPPEPPAAPPPEPTAQVMRVWDRELTVRFSDEQSAFLVGSGPEHLELQLLRDVPAAHAEAIIGEKVSMFGSLFEAFRTGYPGQVTKHISCPERYRPSYAEREVPGGRIRYWLGYANTNRVAGACAEDLVHYRLLHGHLYCDSGVMVDVDLFAPLDDPAAPQRLLDRVDCEI